MAPPRTLPPAAYATVGGGASGSEALRVCRVVAGVVGDDAPAAARSAGSGGGGGGGAGAAEAPAARAMAALAERGFSTFTVGAGGGALDCAGALRRLLGRASADELTVVVAEVGAGPEDGGAARLLRRAAQRRVDTLLTRLRADRVELLQLRWGGAPDGRLLEMLHALAELRAAGKVRCIGAVGFSSRALAAAHAAGLPLDSNCVPWSLLDRRPAAGMAAWCAEHGVAILASDAAGAGLLADRFLGVPEPTRRACTSPGMARFARVIRAWGGWSLFQELLFALNTVAEKYGVTIANVAVRWVLEQQAVAAVVIDGVGVGMEASGFVENSRVFGFALDDDDRRVIDEVASRANDLYQILGEVGTEFQTPSQSL